MYLLSCETFPFSRFESSERIESLFRGLDELICVFVAILTGNIETRSIVKRKVLNMHYCRLFGGSFPFISSINTAVSYDKWRGRSRDLNTFRKQKE